ncbi:hypothetical protein cyc_06366 [Cyclospora cayetanensis]|uniref:G patch domain-containing protein n=1 Tax=Cyclospora cayetanensis TaxID=88456 RepID=A0A1D3D2Y3_9EIME|nr:hypothetical protein cyc_06366 [Cyclospora cayetanensis]
MPVTVMEGQLPMGKPGPASSGPGAEELSIRVCSIFVIQPIGAPLGPLAPRSSLQAPSWVFLGTPICSLSLEELEEQVYKEQPWLRQGGSQRVSSRLLLAAASRAAKIDARRANEALAKARRASQTGCPTVSAKGHNASNVEKAAESALKHASLGVDEATAGAASSREAAVPAFEDGIAKQYQQLAVSRSLAARYFWDGEQDANADRLFGQPLSYKERLSRESCGACDGLSASGRHLATVNTSEGFVCSNFTSSRTSRATHRASRPEEFMDEEDMQQAAQSRLMQRIVGEQQHGEAEKRTVGASYSREPAPISSSWSRVEGASEGLPVFLGAGRDGFAMQPQWCMQSMRRHQWIHRMMHSFRKGGSNSSISASILEEALREAEGETNAKGPQLPRHVEAVRRLMRPELSAQQERSREDRASEAGRCEGAGEGIAHAAAPTNAEAAGLSAMLAAEARASTAEGDNWGEPASQRLLRLQPLGPHRLGLGFHKLLADQGSLPLTSPLHRETDITADARKSFSSRTRTEPPQVKAVGDTLDIDVRQPRTGIRNYALDDDELDEELYATTAPTSTLYDFESLAESGEGRRVMKEPAKIHDVEEKERLQLAAKAAAEGAVVVSEDEQVEEIRGEGDEQGVAAVLQEEHLDDREWVIETFCNLPLPPVPEGFDGIHVATEADEAHYSLGDCNTLADEAEGCLGAQAQGSWQKNAEAVGRWNLSSDNLRILRGGVDNAAAESAYYHTAGAVPASQVQPLWSGVTASTRSSLVKQLGGRNMQWVKEGDEEAAAALARQPVWLQQHQEQLLRRNQQHRMHQQILQMRHRLNCLRLAFVADPETQARFEVYINLRDAEAKAGKASLPSEGVDAPTSGSLASPGTPANSALQGEALRVETSAVATTANELLTSGAVQTQLPPAEASCVANVPLSENAASTGNILTTSEEVCGIEEVIESSTSGQAAGKSQSRDCSVNAISAALRAVAAINAGVPPDRVASHLLKEPSPLAESSHARVLKECFRNLGPLQGAALMCRGPAETAVFTAAYQRIVEQRQLLREQEAAQRTLQQDSLARLGILTEHNVTDATTPKRSLEGTSSLAQNMSERSSSFRPVSVGFCTMLPLLCSHRKTSVFVPSPRLCKLWGIADPWANVAQVDLLRLLREQQVVPDRGNEGQRPHDGGAAAQMNTTPAAASGRLQPPVHVVRLSESEQAVGDDFGVGDLELPEGGILDEPNAKSLGLFKAIFDMDDSDGEES